MCRAPADACTTRELRDAHEFDGGLVSGRPSPSEILCQQWSWEGDTNSHPVVLPDSDGFRPSAAVSDRDRQGSDDVPWPARGISLIANRVLWIA